MQKCTGHLPGPYTIPNVASNIYCVVTNRTPSTAMRGFGITGVDFPIECHRDRVAEAVGMDPIELRILNAYRDGDMKAHRRLAKNCALIECCQVAAGKSGWALSAEAQEASSLRDGGVGRRAEIPETVIDHGGQIGERRREAASPEPLAGGATRARVPAGMFTDHPATGNAPQRADMEAEAERLGFKVSTRAPAERRAPRVAPTPSSFPDADYTPPATPATPPGVPIPYPNVGGSGPSLPRAAQGQAPGGLPQPRPPYGETPHPAAPVSPAQPSRPAAPPQPPQGQVAPPAEPPRPQGGDAAPGTTTGARPNRRPGVSRFISGPRGRQ